MVSSSLTEEGIYVVLTTVKNAISEVAPSARNTPLSSGTTQLNTTVATVTTTTIYQTPNVFVSPILVQPNITTILQQTSVKNVQVAVIAQVLDVSLAATRLPE